MSKHRRYVTWEEVLAYKARFREHRRQRWLKKVARLPVNKLNSAGRIVRRLLEAVKRQGS